MTVAELIEKLKELPQDLPVVAIDGAEGESFVKELVIEEGEIWESIGKQYRGEYVFIKAY